MASQINLSDTKAMRRIDYDVNMKMQSKSKTESTQKSKKRHLRENHAMTKKLKKKQKQVQKARESLEPVIFMREVLDIMRINTPKFEVVPKKFKGEYGLSIKDNRDRSQSHKRKEHDYYLLFRFPHELRQENCLTQMRIIAEGSWSNNRKVKTLFLFLRVEIEKEWEINADDNVRRHESEVYASDDSSWETGVQEDSYTEDRRISKRRVTQQYYLITRTYNNNKCNCYNYELRTICDQREAEELLMRCEKGLRKEREGKGKGIASIINSLILEREERLAQE